MARAQFYDLRLNNPTIVGLPRPCPVIAAMTTARVAATEAPTACTAAITWSVIAPVFARNAFTAFGTTSPGPRMLP